MTEQEKDLVKLVGGKKVTKIKKNKSQMQVAKQ